MKKLFLLLVTVFFTAVGVQAQRKPKPIPRDTASSEAFLLMVEKTLDAFYADYASEANYDSIINALEYEPNQIPEFTDEQICEHLHKMSEQTPFRLDCNAATLNTIRFFAKNRRSFIRIALGRSSLYFDLYEQYLDKYDMPLELRFLSVIESGLRPQVKSPAGALGLWQFMYGTGKMYNLKENAYFDERMDPAKSTDAACRYLKKLYDIYGDWNLALAAYNAGPGNINKAIRRSGGKKTYWEVRPFLPRETQGYVPNFIAAAYLMTYYAEHNLVPMEAKIHRAQLDTMCLRSGVHMETISRLTDWSLEEIQSLNPVYKRTYIPFTQPNQCISGPLVKIGKLVALEDSLFRLEKKLYGTQAAPIVPTIQLPNEPAGGDTVNVNAQEFIYHKVKKGETLTKIAARYKVTNKEIMTWNNLRSTRVPLGKVLKIVTAKVENELPSVQESKTPNPALAERTDSVMGTIYYDSVVQVTHLVQRNESIDVISKIYHVTPAEIKQWNNLKDNWLNIDQKLIIRTKIRMSKPGMVARETPIDPSLTNPEPKPAAVTKKYYVVKTGDLFNRIAQRYGLTTAQLMKLNPGVNPDRIRVGQQLRVK